MVRIGPGEYLLHRQRRRRLNVPHSPLRRQKLSEARTAGQAVQSSSQRLIESNPACAPGAGHLPGLATGPATVAREVGIGPLQEHADGKALVRLMPGSRGDTAM